nr:gdsl esterase/lipase 5 [Quercus suber]
MSLRFHFYILVLYACIIIQTQCLDNICLPYEEADLLTCGDSILDVGNDICLPKEHVALFIFGDSILDVGNNNHINTSTADLQANVSPYGKSFFSSIYFHSIVAAEYANLELIPPYLHPGYNRYIDGANFAWRRWCS